MKCIELKEVTKSFTQGGTTTIALHPTNFVAKSGEFVAIIGPSGSGKSTFLTIAGGLQTPDGGEVRIAEEPFSSCNERERSAIRLRNVGFILQASNLIPFLKVIDQLKLHNKVTKTPWNKDKAMDLLASLGIDKLANAFPSALSGGERQRVAIARAVYHQPALVLADEPTAALDTEKAYEVVGLLSRLTKQLDTTIIMVTHDKRMLDECDAVYEMHDGVLETKK